MCWYSSSSPSTAGLLDNSPTAALERSVTLGAVQLRGLHVASYCDLKAGLCCLALLLLVQVT
jgi:hypothetical protein